MQRDNSFDPAVLDVALRDMPAIREAARRSFSRSTEDDRGGIGAGCAISKYEDGMPTSYDLDFLDRFYNPDVFGFQNLAAGATVAVTANPLSDYVQPYAVAMVVWAFADVGMPAPAQIYQVQINGCNQLNFLPGALLPATATAFLPSQLWNPFARGCKACPVTWGPYGNESHRNAQLQMQVGNGNAFAISGLIISYGVNFDCCPPYTTTEAIMNGQSKPGRLPIPAAPAPSTATRRSAF